MFVRRDRPGLRLRDPEAAGHGDEPRGAGRRVGRRVGGGAGGVVFGVVAVATAVLGDIVMNRAIPVIALGVATVVVGLQVLAARRAGVPERYIDTNGRGGLLFSAVAAAVSVYALISMTVGYEQVNGAAVMCGLATATVRALRQPRLAEHPPRGRARRRGGAVRDTVTAAALQADKDAAIAAGDNRAAEIIDRQIAALDGLPDGFRIDRTRGDVVTADRDPGLELSVIDERHRPDREIATAHRAFVGRHMIAWSGGRYLDVESATAHCVMVRLAVLDAERFTTPTTTSQGAPA